MGYPADPSNFTRNTLLSAYFFQGDEVLQTDGYVILNDFAQEVQSMLSRLQMRDADGVLLTAADVPQEVGGAYRWDAVTLRALYAAAQGLRVDPAFLEAVRADAEARGTISPATLATLLWVTYTNQRHEIVSGRDTGRILYGFGSPDELNIPAGSVLPSFGTAIAPGPSVTSGLTRSPVPRGAQPAPLALRVRDTGGSALVAILFLAGLAAAAGLAMSTVKSKPVRKNPRQSARENPHAWMGPMS